MFGALVRHVKRRSENGTKWPRLTMKNHPSATPDPDLELVNKAWDRLPEAILAGIVATVSALSGLIG